MTLDEAMAELPLVAILRGIRPEEAQTAAEVLVEAGFRLIEVPLNSPDPLRSIEAMASGLADRAVIGAGTVMSEADVAAVRGAGGRLIVMPHSDPAVIHAAKNVSAWCMPGVATPTEGFAALAAGADALKLFPGEAIPPAVVKAWRAVFPKSARLIPVGGITPDNLAPYLSAGAAGFGIGSALYSPGISPSLLRDKARAFIIAWRNSASS